MCEHRLYLDSKQVVSVSSGRFIGNGHTTSAHSLDHNISFGCVQAQKTVEEQRAALGGMAKLQGTAAQTKARLMAARKRLKSLEWEHEVRPLPALITP